MIKLNVPYRSQWANDAQKKNGDCGPTCLAMILNFRGQPISPDQVYDHIKYEKGDPDPEKGLTNFNQLMAAADKHSVKLTYKRYDDQDKAFRNLRANLDAGNPAIALIKYLPWKTALGNHYDYGHFVVITGYDDRHVYMHDPLFGLWVKPPETGAHYAMPYDLFASGWGTAHEDNNSNWSLAYSGNVVSVDAAPPPPVPQPVPTPPITPPPPPPQPSTTPVKIMEDVNRRIRALAAYRWAEAPDFSNPDAVKLWSDNLGDFAREYEDYVVQGGDTLSGLAARHYGQQNRWPAIKVFNDLPGDSLWKGVTIRIPRLGSSGAQSNPALPHDTADFSKDLEFLAVDENAPPLDYNELMGEGSKGIG